MAAKEPTVEAVALDIVKRCSTWDGSEPDEDPEELIAQAIRDASQAAAEKAWDEGYSAGAGDLLDVNPYRLPKGPTK